MKEAEFSCQHALAEASVTRPQHRSAIGSEPGGDAQTWRDHVPGVEGAQPRHDGVGLLPLRIDPRQVLADRLAVIEPYPALIVSRLPSVMASLANAEDVRNRPPEFEGLPATACEGAPLTSM